MKFVLPYVVHICCWLAFSSASAQNGSANQTGNARVHQALDFLKTTRPMYYPDMNIISAETKDRKAVELLFKHQVQAIDSLEEYADASVVPLLIPYLNYTRHPLVDMFDTGQPLDFAAIKAEYPAFATIISNPDAADALATYVLDRKNSLEYRMTAFHVLRYVDRAKFGAVAVRFESEITREDAWTKSTFNFIRTRNIPFSGIHVDTPDRFTK